MRKDKFRQSTPLERSFLRDISTCVHKRIMLTEKHGAEQFIFNSLLYGRAGVKIKKIDPTLLEVVEFCALSAVRTGGADGRKIS